MAMRKSKKYHLHQDIYLLFLFLGLILVSVTLVFATTQTQVEPGVSSADLDVPAGITVHKVEVTP